MKLETSFRTFIQNVQIKPKEEENLKLAYEDLRKNLKEFSKDSDFKELIITEFVQGSFKRKTCLKNRDGKAADIDVVIVTKMDEGEFTPPELAQKKFLPFVEKFYSGQYEPQGRSIGLTLKQYNAELDIVITSNPKEAQVGFLTEELFQEFDSLYEDFNQDSIKKSLKRVFNAELRDGRIVLANSQEDLKLDPLRIPDRDAKVWQDTNPMAQIFWTIQKNQRCNNIFLPVVRAAKWMHANYGGFPKYPKGYPLEHIVGDCCPDGIISIGEGLTLTLEKIVTEYEPFILSMKVPYLRDRGVNCNVLSRQSFDDFKLFYNRIKDAATLARKALDCDDSYESSKLWRELLGAEFPLSEKPTTSKGYVAPTTHAQPETKRNFAYLNE